MNTFKEKLQNGEFVVSAELEPPKGTDISEFINKAKIIKPWVDAVNVTDNQRAMLRLSSASGCTILKQMGLEPIFQVTSRDRNRLAIQSDLLGVNALGVKNVLAISGDYPTLGDHPGAKIVYDVDSVHILDIVSKMNKGVDMRGHQLEGGTDFFPGAVFNSNVDMSELQLFKIKLKCDQGAKFFQTQIIYDVKRFKEFIDQFASYGIERDQIFILAGILPFRSAKNARFINDNVPGINIPQWMINELETAQDPKKLGLEISANLIKELQPVCDGVHIMTVGREKMIPKLMEAIGFKPSNNIDELNALSS
ncbi:MAG: methylenetetrahydrofolate reductase [Cyanobacteriota bacterium]